MSERRRDPEAPLIKQKSAGKPPSQEKPLTHTDKLKAERERKRKEKELKDQAKLLEIEAKIQKAREKMEQAKKEKSNNAKETRPGNRRQREMNEDFGDVYDNQEGYDAAYDEPAPPKSRLPPRGSGATNKHSSNLPKGMNVNKQRSMPVDSSPAERHVNLDQDGSSQLTYPNQFADRFMPQQPPPNNMV